VHEDENHTRREKVNSFFFPLNAPFVQTVPSMDETHIGEDKD
jgi:hypothetical protein